MASDPLLKDYSGERPKVVWLDEKLKKPSTKEKRARRRKINRLRQALLRAIRRHGKFQQSLTNGRLTQAVFDELGRDYITRREDQVKTMFDYCQREGILPRKAHIPKPISRKRSSAFYDSPAWRRLRYKVLRDRGARCECCKCEDKQMHVDHVKPRSKYPELELTESNLQILCVDCNLGKGAWDQTDWRK